MFSYLLSTTTVNSTRACTKVHETINFFVLVLVQILVLVLVHTISIVQSEEVYTVICTLHCHRHCTMCYAHCEQDLPTMIVRLHFLALLNQGSRQESTKFCFSFVWVWGGASWIKKNIVEIFPDPQNMGNGSDNYL